MKCQKHNVVIRTQIKHILRFPGLHVYSGVTIGTNWLFDRHILANMCRQGYYIYNSNDWNSRISLDKFPVIFDSEASTQKCSYKKVFWNIQQIYMPKWDFNKVAKQLYWYYTSTWVFYCKFAAYFQNTFEGLLLTSRVTFI